MASSESILTAEQIEIIVRKLPTSQKRINARKRLRKTTNKEIDAQIATMRTDMRRMKAMGFREGMLRERYSAITKLELKYLCWPSRPKHAKCIKDGYSLDFMGLLEAVSK